MKVFVDTNLFIDILLGREPFFHASSLVYKLCENGLAEGIIAPITVNNIYYICRKARHQEEIKSFLGDIASVFSIALLDEKSVRKAHALPMKDYEDALQYAMAQQCVCDYLITRNTKDFPHNGHVRIITPEVFLKETGIDL